VHPNMNAALVHCEAGLRGSGGRSRPATTRRARRRASRQLTRGARSTASTTIAPKQTTRRAAREAKLGRRGNECLLDKLSEFI
jgi:hypothetical protein